MLTLPGKIVLWYWFYRWTSSSVWEKIGKKWFCRLFQITEMAQVIHNIYKWLQINFAVSILNVVPQVLILCTVWASLEIET